MNTRISGKTITAEQFAKALSNLQSKADFVETPLEDECKEVAHIDIDCDKLSDFIMKLKEKGFTEFSIGRLVGQKTALKQLQMSDYLLPPNKKDMLELLENPISDLKYIG